MLWIQNYTHVKHLSNILTFKLPIFKGATSTSCEIEATSSIVPENFHFKGRETDSSAEVTSFQFLSLPLGE